MYQSLEINPPYLLLSPDGKNRLISLVEFDEIDIGGYFIAFGLDEIPPFKSDVTGRLVESVHHGDYEDFDYPELDFDWNSDNWTTADRAISILSERFAAFAYFDELDEAQLALSKIKDLANTTADVEARIHFGFSRARSVEIVKMCSEKSRTLLSVWPQMKMPAEYYVALFMAKRVAELKEEIANYRGWLTSVKRDAKSRAEDGDYWRYEEEDESERRDSRNFWEKENNVDAELLLDDDDDDDDELSDQERESRKHEKRIEERSSEIQDGVLEELRFLDGLDLSNSASNLEFIWCRYSIGEEWADTIDGESSYLSHRYEEQEEIFLTAGNLAYRWVDDSWSKAYFVPFHREDVRLSGATYRRLDLISAQKFIAENYSR
jgi:hypothetical protein